MSHKKNNIVNVIHMHKFAVCTWLVSLLVNYSHIFFAFVVTQWFLSCVLNIIHVLNLESVWFQTFMQRITLDMFYVLFVVIVVTWNVNEISIGWVIKTLEAQVDQFLLGCKCPVSRCMSCKNKTPLVTLLRRFSFKMSFNCTSRDK